MAICRKHYDYINVCIDAIDSNIAILAMPFQELIELAVTVPSIKEQSATFIAEIGDNMSVFHSSKHLCSWVGLTPQNNESAGKKKSVHVSRAGVYLNPLLVQPMPQSKIRIIFTLNLNMTVLIKDVVINVLLLLLLV